MRNYFLPIAAVALLFAACSDSSSDANLPTSTLTVLKNNSMWSGTATANYDTFVGGDTVDVHATNNFEYMHLRFKLTGVGVSVVAQNSVVYTTTIGGDVIDKMYVLVSPGSVNITSYTPGTAVIEGTFALTLRRVGANETLQLKSGKFNTKIE